MGTTATETLAVAGNIFVGMVSTLRPSDNFFFPWGIHDVAENRLRKVCFPSEKSNK